MLGRLLAIALFISCIFQSCNAASESWGHSSSSDNSEEMILAVLNQKDQSNSKNTGSKFTKPLEQPKVVKNLMVPGNGPKKNIDEENISSSKKYCAKCHLEAAAQDMVYDQFFSYEPTPTYDPNIRSTSPKFIVAFSLYPRDTDSKSRQNGPAFVPCRCGSNAYTEEDSGIAPVGKMRYRVKAPQSIFAEKKSQKDEFSENVEEQSSKQSSESIQEQERKPSRKAKTPKVEKTAASKNKKEVLQQESRKRSSNHQIELANSGTKKSSSRVQQKKSSKATPKSRKKN
jgi:hypothetical protein